MVAKSQLGKARNYIKTKPYLMWYTKNFDNLSSESIVESVLTSGDWQDFLTIKDIFGLENLSDIFETIDSKKRNNLRPQTRNYFSKYFEKYAQ